MKAARFYEVGKPLRIEDIEAPRIGPDEALVKVRACGLCHTDLHFLEGVLKPGKIPITLGHEVAGEVIELGEQVREILTGDRVNIHLYFTCGKCYYCQTGWESLCTDIFGHLGFTVDGGYAEYVKAPARNLFKLPNALSFDEGAVLVDAVSSSFHAVKGVAQVRLGETVVVYGAGGLGAYALQIAKLSGARVIAIDVVEEKLEMARRLGADDTINAKNQDVTTEIKRLTKQGADVVLDFVGISQTMKTALNCLKRRGRLVFIGYSDELLQVSPKRLVYDGLQIVGSRASSRHELAQVIELAKEKKIKAVITRTFQLSEINHALELLAKGKIIGRAVIKP